MWESLLTFDIFNKLQRRTTRIHPSYKFVDVTQFHIHRTEFVISSYNMLYISNNLQVHYDTNQISNFYINTSHMTGSKIRDNRVSYIALEKSERSLSGCKHC
jgi:hypothetical protein